MYQQRLQPQQIVPVSYDSPKMQQFIQQPQPKMQLPPQNTTFIQNQVPLPTQIQQQRLISQKQSAQQLMLQEQEKQSYVHQVQQTQRQRFVRSQSPTLGGQPTHTPERPPLQGGMPPSKPWMGEDVYLVAFLLGVELQRLRDENEKLQGEKDSVDAKARALGIVETELREARHKMGEYEKKNALLISELEGWKSKFQAKEQEQEDQRYNQDFNRRLAVDREIRELSAKFISDRNYLENENRKLRQEYDEIRLKHSSVDDIIQSAEQIQIENSRLRRELDNYRQGFEQLEYVFKTASDLENENENLRKELQETRGKSIKSQGDDQLRQENTELRKQLSQKIPPSNNANVDKLQKELQMFEAENRRLRERLNYQQVPQNRQEGAFCY